MSLFQKTRALPGGLAAQLSIWGIALLLCVLLAAMGCHSSSDADRHALTPQEERGKVIYGARCVACHDPYSTSGRQGPGLKGVFRKQSLPSGAPANDDRARDAIMLGRRNMPGFQYALEEQQISDLLAYLHTL